MIAAPIFGALLIGATYVVGARYGARVGLASAAVVASTPIFISGMAQPMGQVPAAALWMTAVAGVTSPLRRRSVLGGIAAGAAIATGPLLAPLAIPLGVFLLLRPERVWRERLGAAGWFAAAAAAGAACGALIDAGFSGAVISWGHERVDARFDTQNVASNATRYASWLSHTLSPGWVLAAAAPFLLPGALTRLLLWMFLLNVACYLPYAVSNDWTGLRFLLSTLPLVVILGVAVIDSLCRRTWSWISRPVLLVVSVAMIVFGIRQATLSD